MLSDDSRILAGVLLLALVTVETGGLYLVRLVRGNAPATPFQISFARAGREQPNKLIALVFAGAALLAVSLVSLGVGLLTA